MDTASMDSNALYSSLGSHRGERCSFDALIVRGADTGRPDLDPRCERLLAASLALAKRFADDQEMLDNAKPVYDALYAECRG